MVAVCGVGCGDDAADTGDGGLSSTDGATHDHDAAIHTGHDAATTAHDAGDSAVATSDAGSDSAVAAGSATPTGMFETLNSKMAAWRGVHGTSATSIFVAGDDGLMHWDGSALTMIGENVNTGVYAVSATTAWGASSSAPATSPCI
jgi:hypothetical protein